MLKKVLGAVAFCALTAMSASAQDVLRLGHFIPPAGVEHAEIMQPWADRINEAAAGSIEIKVFPGGALGAGPVAQFERAVDGVADITYGLPGFTAATFPLTGIIEYPGVASTGEKGVEALYRALPIMGSEWEDVHVLGLWVSEPLFIISRDKPVRSIADFQGMKIRTPSSWQAEVVTRLGGIPVAMPISDVYISLETGVIDGVLTGPIGASSFKLTEVGKYFTVGLPLGRLPFFLVMNKDRWNALTDEQKELVNKYSGIEFAKQATSIHEKFGETVIQSLANDPGKEVIEMDEQALAEAADAISTVRDDMTAELDKNGLPGTETLNAMMGM
jgi:TRAP-type transport system periplasmic protein